MPKDGVRPFNDLVYYLSGIMYYKANYTLDQNNGNDSNVLKSNSEAASRIRRVVSRMDIGSFSPELQRIIDENVIHSKDGGTIQQISSILPIILEARNKVINQNLYVDDMIIDESEIQNLYNTYRQSGSIYISDVVMRNHNPQPHLEGENLIYLIAPNAYKEFTGSRGMWKGNLPNKNRDYRTFIIWDYANIGEFFNTDTEDWPHV